MKISSREIEPFVIDVDALETDLKRFSGKDGAEALKAERARFRRSLDGLRLKCNGYPII